MEVKPTCQLCDRPQDGAMMEHCCLCNKWEHAECAGLFDGNKDPDTKYVCSKCKDKQESTAAKFREDRGSASLKPSTRSRKGSTASTRRNERGTVKSITSTCLSTDVREQLKLIEEERSVKEREIQEQREMLRRKNEESARQLEEKRKLAEEENLRREIEMKAEAELIAREQNARRESLEKKRELMRQLSLPSRLGTDDSYSEKVVCWLSTNQGMSEQRPNSHEDALSRSSSAFERMPRVASSPVTETKGKMQYEGKNGETGELTGRQIAARHVIGKDIPSFSGDPEDWPLFYSSFTESTDTCGFSSAENLIRLKRCLKGNALELVKEQLTLKENVQDVIKTLKMVYGKPSLLIRSLMNKIRDLPPPKPDKMRTMIEFGLTVKALTNHMRAAGLVEHLKNPSLLEELEDKLPGEMKLSWAAFQEEKSVQGLEGFSLFASRMAERACLVTNDLKEISRIGEKRRKNTVALNVHDAPPNAQPIKPPPQPQIRTPVRKTCAVCQREGHRIYECDQFKAATVDERSSFVESKHLCRTCLNDHGNWPCKSWRGCAVDGCRVKHHTLLHPEVPVREAVSACATHIDDVNTANPMFRILPVTLYHGNLSKTIYAFFDEGSSYSLIDESIARELNVHGQKAPLKLQWTGHVTRTESNSEIIGLQISGQDRNKQYKLENVRTVSQLMLTPQTLEYKTLKEQFPHLSGLPIQDYEQAQPQLLIGLDNLRLGVPLELREGRPTEPIAAKCRLGWSIYGGWVTNTPQSARVNFHTRPCTDCDQAMKEQFNEHFTMEEQGTSTYRGIPESEDEPRDEIENRVGTDSYPMTVRRMESQESEFEKAFYSPQGVMQNSKNPDNIRLVWEATAKVKGVSLNSRTMKEPDFPPPLSQVLCRFRKYPVAVSGDLTEMFHLSRIRHLDRQSQRFVYRKKPPDPMQVYMDVATFVSPQHVKKLNAQVQSKASSDATNAILQDHYVDDYPQSLKTVEEACKIVKKVKLVHSKGGLMLRRFLPNSSAVLEGIGDPLEESAKDLMPEQGEDTRTVIGMKWKIDEDVFTFSSSSSESFQHVSLFDPIGLVSIFLIHGKIFIRYKDNPRSKGDDKPQASNVRELAQLRKAESALWKNAQKEAVSDEKAGQSRTKDNPKGRQNVVLKPSPIYKRWPFLDDDGILRTRGRVGSSIQSSFDAKHQSILPKTNYCVFLIVDWFHRKYRRVDGETVENQIRRRLDIPNLRAWASTNPPPMEPFLKMRPAGLIGPFSCTGS